MSQDMKITSIQELVEASKGSIVELPPFSEGTKFYARLKRPSLLGLAKSGQIPNELLSSANTLFTGNAQRQSMVDENMLESMFGVMELLCQEAFVEPSYNKLKEYGIELTDDQMMFVFNYTQTGVNSLSSFRQ